MKRISALSLIFLSLNLFSQRGKDGTPTIGAANTIVNIYTPLTSNVTAGTTTLNVGSSASFAIGDLVFIIQMQGTSVNAYHGGTTGPWFDSFSALPIDTTFGRITNFNNCGLNEFAQVRSIPNNTSIVIDCGLKNDYDVTRTVNIQTGSINLLGNVQVIRVPRYTSLTLNGSGTISCPQWNGSVGGVTVVEVENNTILNSVGALNASGKGFRGGAVFNYTPTAIISSDKYGSNRSQEGGGKGESIAGDSAFYRNYASVFSRGNMANGGGGGNSHNAGGGGGANGHNGVAFNSLGNPTAGFNTIWNLEFSGMATNTSSGGGRGGYSFSNSNQNVSTVAPGTYSTPSNAWGGDKRRSVGGFGGRPLNYINGRLFLGGGGGGGQGNDAKATPGGNGGGLVYLVCYGNVSGSGTILADGANASNTGAGCTANDGAGGGGGGGAIVLKVNGPINLTAGTALSAVGGNGGNVNFSCGFFNGTAYGPGAGGGGGYIATTSTLPSNTIAGGNNGTVTGNANNIGNNFPPNGATKGGSGGSGAVTAYTLNTSVSQTICTNQSYTVTASSTEPGTSINWYNTNVGGSAIATGTAYASSGYTTAGTYTLFAGACTGTYRQPITITVSAGLNITVNSPTICPSQTVTLTAGGATTYTWNTGPTTSTINVSPSSTTIYTINGTSGLCVGTKTTMVTVSAQPTVSVANTSICSGNSTTLTANGATSYTWAAGGQTTSSIVVTPTTNTTYTITGYNGACTNSTTASVNVTNTPTLIVNSVTICPSQTATLSVSGASSYTWNPGNVSGTSYTMAPTSNTIITVIGANGTCTSSSTASITIGTGISITVNSPTICAGQTASLSASGAATYTWSSGATTNTLNINPSATTVYTISGTSGACSGQNTATVNVVNQPTVTVANASICAGNSATLTANGASSYTWATGGQTTSSIVVTPTTNTTYTITGSNGICSNTTTASINVTATPTLVANSVTICANQTATLTASGATTYTWNPGNITGTSYTIAPTSNTIVTVIGANGTCTTSSTPSITIGTGISISANSPTICAGQTASLSASGAATYTWSSGATTNTLNVSPSATTIYTISGSNGTCNGINTTTVTVNALPTLTVNTAAICSGQTATLVASGANTYTWSNSVNGNSQTVNPTTTTIYTVVGTSLNGCTNSTSTSVTVTSTPTINVNSPSICSGQTATLTATGATNYTWSTSQTTSSINITPALTTTYSVIGDNDGCSTTLTTTVSVDNTALSTYTSAVSTCPSQAVALLGLGTNSATSTFTWSNGVNTYSQTVAPINTTTYVVNATSASGCPASSGTVVVTVNSISASYDGIDNNIMTVGEILNLNNTSTGATSITWDYCNGTSTNNQITIPLTAEGSCCIKLVASNSSCTDSITKCVTIITEASVTIPNVFTPNGDTKNDLFKIKSTGLKSLNCVIYDRWGLKMYEWDGINGYWDGNTKSGIAPDGTYFYIINYTDLRDKSTTEKGHLNLFN